MMRVESVFALYRDSGASFKSVYLQKLDVNGTMLLGANGLLISTDIVTPTMYLSSSEIVSDGDKGCVVAFVESAVNANGRVIVQRRDTNGTLVWATTVTSAAQDAKVKGAVRLIKDNAGGWIVAWFEARTAPALPEVYAQRLSLVGAAQWTADGVQVAPAPAGSGPSFDGLHMIADGSGGAILGWLAVDDGEVRTQRINSAGTNLWGATPNVVRTGVTAVPWGELCSDGSGGAFFVLIRLSRVELFRINSTGTSAFGVAQVSNAAHVADWHGIVSDGAGGCLVCWRSGISGSPRFWTNYAQRYDASGFPQWAAGGIAAGIAPYPDVTPESSYSVVSDGQGGALIAQTAYDVTGDLSTTQITRWSSTGTVLLQDLPASNTVYFNYIPKITVTGEGGLVAGWVFSDGVGNNQLRANVLSPSGAVLWGSNGVALTSLSATTFVFRGVAGAQQLLAIYTPGPDVGYALAPENDVELRFNYLLHDFNEHGKSVD